MRPGPIVGGVTWDRAILIGANTLCDVLPINRLIATMPQMGYDEVSGVSESDRKIVETGKGTIHVFPHETDKYPYHVAFYLENQDLSKPLIAIPVDV